MRIAVKNTHIRTCRVFRSQIVKSVRLLRKSLLFLRFAKKVKFFLYIYSAFENEQVFIGVRKTKRDYETDYY